MKPDQVSKDMSFGEWLSVTLELERAGFGQDPVAFEGDRRGDFLGAMLHAAHCEITEASDECGWKPWTKPRGWVNREALISELTDAMHFLALLLNTVECTGDELTAAYLKSVRKNYARQEKGDDGVSRRCGGCGRSLDDVGTEFVGAFGSKPYETQCKACGTKVEEVA